MKTRVRRIGALIIGVVIASVLLISLHQLSSTATAEHTGVGNTHPPSFNPVSSIELSSNTADGITNHETTFNVLKPDVNFGGSGAALVTFLPGDWCVATHSADCATVDGSNNPTGPAVPTGTITGDVDSITKLALQSTGLNEPCNQTFPVDFPKFVEALPDDGAGTPSAPPYTTADTIAPLTTNPAAGNLLNMNQDADSNGNIDGADKWPTYNSELLDPDGAGAATPVFPIARYAGDQVVSGTEVFLQTLVFAPGALTAFSGQPWDSFSASLGNPVLTILQNPLEANPSIIADFCTDLTSVTTVLGTTLANSTACRLCSAAASVAGGSVLRRNSTAISGIGNSGTHIYRLTAQGGRDFDQDSYENGLDTCKTLANLDGDPRSVASKGADLDSLDSACDPRPLAMTQFDPALSEDGGIAGTCGDGIDNGGGDGVDIWDVNDCHTVKIVTTGGLDIDGDGWLNRLDNCPLVANGALQPPEQEDLDVALGTAVPGGGSPFDDIGDACEPDYDGDTVADAEEAGLSTTTSDGGYLDAVVKSFACNGAADTDKDGWCDARETFSGTDINDDCAANTSIDAVPVDNNNDKAVNIQDRAAIVAQQISEIGGGASVPRLDLNSDGNTNILDRAATVASNGWECT